MQLVRSYRLPLLLLITFCIAFYPSLVQIISKWYSSEDYTHAFLTVPIVGYMIWVKRDVLVNNTGRPIIGFIFIVLSLCIYLLSFHLQIPTFLFFATNLTLMSCLVYFAGFRALKKFTFPLLLMFMLIPIPNQILSTLTYSLQLRVSEVGEFIIQAFSIPIFREGNVLHVASRSFLIAEACSGIRSLISMTTLSLIIGYFTLKRTFTIILLFLSSVPIAIFINILRVVFLVLAYHYYHIDLSVGTSHTITGVILFALGLILLFFTVQVLQLWETRKKNS